MQVLLDVLDVPICIDCDGPQLVAQVKACFGAFERSSLCDKPHRIRMVGGDESYSISFEGRSDTFSLLPSWPRPDDFIGILIGRERRDLVFIHGSSVLSDSGVYVFVGGTTSGKTTLALGLRKYGYSLLADDVTPIDLSSSTALFYPTGIRMRNRTRQLLGPPSGREYCLEGSADRRSVKSIFLLHPATTSRVRAISCTTAVDIWARMQTLCLGEQRLSAEMRKGKLLARDKSVFERTPVIEPCQSVESLAFLLKHMRYPMPPLKVLLPIMQSFLFRTPCFKLVPGHLSETVEIVHETISNCGQSGGDE